MAVTDRRRLAVIGGGIAGLAAAYELSLAAAGQWQVLLIEAEERLGGKIETEREDGLVLELGPDSFLITKPWARQLCRELGIEDELVGTNREQRAVYILKDGELLPLPDGLTMMVPTRISSMATTRLLSPLGKGRAALEILLPAANGHGSESIEEFVSRRFGAELYARMVEPMMSGIYAGDGSQLSIEATFPLLPRWERQHGSVTRGALTLRRQRRERTQGASRWQSLFLAPREGLAQMVEALSASLVERGVDLRLGHPVTRIDQTREGYRITVDSSGPSEVDGLILATPAFVTADLVSPLAPNLAERLSEIDYASTATVNLFYEDETLAAGLDGYGYVIPRREGRPALACTWTTTKFPGRAPEGTALLRVFLGRAGQEEALEGDDESLLALARQELKLTLGIDQPASYSRVRRWPRGMPQYNVGHLKRVAEIHRAAQQLPRLELAGAGYDGIGIPDCVNSGRRAARSLLLAASDLVPIPSPHATTSKRTEGP